MAGQDRVPPVEITGHRYDSQGSPAVRDRVADSDDAPEASGEEHGNPDTRNVFEKVADAMRGKGGDDYSDSELGKAV
jgi:hypothetical protein